MNLDNDNTNPDFVGMDDVVAAIEPPPPMFFEGLGNDTNKVDVQAQTNEVTM